MERSAATGILAANTILAARGYVTEPVWSVPTRGMLAGRRSRAGYPLAGLADPA
jgi:isorenieratene synthase